MLDGLVLGIGRFPKIVSMPVADAPATRRAAPPSPSTFPSYTGLLVGLLVGALLILGGLDFFPALALCSVAGHIALRCGLFVGLLVGFVLIVGGVTLAPAITLGPVTENLGRQPPSLDWNTQHGTGYRISHAYARGRVAEQPAGASRSLQPIRE